MTFHATDPVEVRASGTFEVSADCGGGNGGTFKGTAKLMFWRLKNKHRLGAVEMMVPEGKVFPACGKLFRLAGLLPDGGFIIDKSPVAPPPGVVLRADALAIPVDGLGQVGACRIGVEQIGPAGATLALREVEFAEGTDEPPTRIETKKVEVSVGSRFTLLGEVYEVAAIVRPLPAKDLLGWVEVAPVTSN